MRFVKLTIAYDGKSYVGWQFQSNGISVQERLEEAWLRLTGEQRRITASGRTDSGVHALGQVCCVQTNSELPPAVLVRGLNTYLPDDIAVLAAGESAENFDPIREAVSKTYRYQIQSGSVCNVLAREQWWYVPPRLDVEAMRAGAAFLLGEHDFSAFQTAGSGRISTIRNVTELRIESWNEDLFQWVQIFVSSNGFLYNMVRCIAGTLAEVGKGKQTPEWCRNVLESLDRTISGATAPAHGLCLMKVKYDEP